MQNYINIIENLENKYSKKYKINIYEYIKQLIFAEYKRYNNDISIFTSDIDKVIEGKSSQDSLLNSATFITLAPLEEKVIESEEMEKLIFNWNNKLMYGNYGQINYPTNLKHYFDIEMSDDPTEEEIINASYQDKFNALVECEEKRPCTVKLISDMKDILLNKSNVSSSEYILSTLVMNYRFLRIHPCYDGNGRTSRMLLNAMLNSREDILPVGFSKEEIDKLNGIYIKASEILHIASCGFYLKDLYFDISADMKEVENSTLANGARILEDKQNDARKVYTLKT